MPSHSSRIQSCLRQLRTLVTLVAGFACLILAPQAGRAAIAQWISPDFQGNWNTPSAWSGGVVPNNTQSATYLVTIAQQVGHYANVVANLPGIEVDQLTIRNTATVRVPSGTTLRLRDMGAGVNLQRSFAGGGVVRIDAGGTLSVGLSGGVISGDIFTQMNGGRIFGIGAARFENARVVNGFGTIGNDSSQFDAALRVYNTGSVGANPNLTRISADQSGKTLTLGFGGSEDGIQLINHYAMLNAANGGLLDLRGRGSFVGGADVDNANGVIEAGASSEVRLSNGLDITGGTIRGDGVLRVASGANVTIRNADVTTTTAIIEGDAALERVRNTNLIVAGHLALTATTGKANAMTSLSLNGTTSTLDVGTRPLIINYAPGVPPPQLPILSMLNLLAADRVATSMPGRTAGIAEASAVAPQSWWAGETIDMTTLLLLPTLAGDANLDSKVDFTDLVRLAGHYNTAGVWSDGDFDYSGKVNFTDLVLLARHYNASAPVGSVLESNPSLAADWALAQSLVPEPAAIALACLAFALRGVRRR